MTIHLEQIRQRECTARQVGQCSLVNVSVGFPVACSLSQCDQCWNQGGTEGQHWKTYVANVVGAVRQNPSIIPQAARPMFEELHGPLPPAGPSPKDQWEKVRSTWEMAESFVRSMASRGPGALVGEGRRVALPIKARRFQSCSTCPHFTLSKNGRSHFCNTCGCGDTALAQLDNPDNPNAYTKLDYPFLECPLGRDGFSNADPSHLPAPATSSRRTDERGPNPVTLQVRVPRERVVHRDGMPVEFDGRWSGMGDLIAALWVAEGYKERGIETGFLVEDGSKVRILEMFGHKRTFNTKNLVMLGGSARHYQHELRVDQGKTGRVELWASLMPWKPVPRRPAFLGRPAVGETMRKWIRAEAGEKPLVLLFPFSMWQTRNWPLGKWVDLAWALEGRGWHTQVLLASGQERIRGVDKLPRWAWGLDLEEVAWMGRMARVSVSNDSGPAHLVGTAGGRVVAVCGPLLKVFDHDENVEVVKGHTACTGCMFRKERGHRAACDVECESLGSVGVEEVLERVLSHG